MLAIVLIINLTLSIITLHPNAASRVDSTQARPILINVPPSVSDFTGTGVIICRPCQVRVRTTEINFANDFKKSLFAFA